MIIKDFNSWKESQVNEAASQDNSSILSKLYSSLSTAAGFAMNPILWSIIKVYNSIWNKSADKIRLIFPGPGWETSAVNLLKKLGVVTGVFKSAEDAIATAKSLSSTGIKAKELVIGSHGNGSTLLITQKEHYSAYQFTPDLLKNLKPMVTSETKVFFTACYGANDLMNLVDSANQLGVGVYGSKGIYNYVTNSSEKGYYYCTPYQVPKPTKSIEIRRDTVYSGETTFDVGSFSGRWLDNVSIKFIGAFEEHPNLTVTFTPASFAILGWQTSQLTQITGTITKDKISSYGQTYCTKEEQQIYEYELYLTGYTISNETELRELGLTQLADLVKSGKLKWPDAKKAKFGENFKKAAQAGHIILSINGVNILKRPNIQGYFVTEVGYNNNEHLLKAGVCRKVNAAPVSWV